MHAMKKISKEFTKQILKEQGWPDTLEEALEQFDRTASILVSCGINRNELIAARNYLIREYKSIEVD